jgi:hypothetical protein
MELIHYFLSSSRRKLVTLYKQVSSDNESCKQQSLSLEGRVMGG